MDVWGRLQKDGQLWVYDVLREHTIGSMDSQSLEEDADQSTEFASREQCHVWSLRFKVLGGQEQGKNVIRLCEQV